MARIQELLEGRDERIDYECLTTRAPWILERNQQCILSPDSDGLLCGLFMSHFLDWEIKGFYDGKVMILENEVSAHECIFLDMEIFRRNIRSIGHHMVLYNRNEIPENWHNFDNCIQPNNMRNYDSCHDFRLKYPLATIHLLMGIVGSRLQIRTPETAICPLLFTDGTFNVLFKYPENVLNWLRFLRAGEEGNPLRDIFENERYSVFSLMQAMDDFFRRRDEISISGERGDKLKISDTIGNPYNINSIGDAYEVDQGAVNRIEQFIEMLATLIGWGYNAESWTWTNLRLYEFTKGSFDQDGLRLNGQNYQALIARSPLSWAMTSGQNLEYTIEEPDTTT